ncbi:MAG: Xaa-Pro aminopeptidase [Bacteroidetes bacterium GWE2_41_25]|nr:MAG: Xaa-Pro aminopeptidase [Bacteroidetes bacterium GWE2_41_25]OFY59448.1 MAG: Xaa-Pro aminopeptidase [Bacteroidetes bacterium GWF2_41_9]HAM10695.1 Xaa-Pro aminopeptidase [Bacteroidales bacterium]HBH85374.1 Xaa-Pro aminopeptidase [Bacteroidales bacterium]HCU18859.1 Xaa-Pro aminopeptidase [Bacteroidales bacterium]
MFKSEVYVRRREQLCRIMKSGVALFIGNNESAFNYPANTYHFRQDSDFLYFFGLDHPGFAGVIDFDSETDMVFGNDFDMDDIIWMGPQPTVKELAAKCGVTITAPMSKLEEKILDALAKKRKVHFLPPYRGESKMILGSLLKENPCQMKTIASVELIMAVVSMRSVKEKIEIDEIEKAIDIAYGMHVTAMKMCRHGVKEQDIFGAIEGIALAKGGGTSFPITLSINGQTLHNHSHGNILKRDRMMVTDAGAETNLHYASDITRTTPVGGKFSQMQKDVYEIVLNANTEAIKATKPGISNREIHFLACRIIADGMKGLGLMKGDIDEAVAAGAHALFMPHGIGHMMGLDVHDMEALGENFIGYNDEVKRSEQFGTAFLRFALPYKPGHVFTIEPGCYFIPELIEKWKSEARHKEFINYDKIAKFMPIGGIRIEDDVLITEKGHKVLGKPIPKTIEDIEAVCSL